MHSLWYDNYIALAGLLSRAVRTYSELRNESVVCFMNMDTFKYVRRILGLH
jgi:hypothetical protein